ncbi:hypothetical protein GCM10010464_54970 [Pseudonocardia yunnanensis]
MASRFARVALAISASYIAPPDAASQRVRTHLVPGLVIPVAVADVRLVSGEPGAVTPLGGGRLWSLRDHD